MKNRGNIEGKFKWDIEAMYPDEGAWDKDYKEVNRLADEFVESYKGRLGEDLPSAFKDKDVIWQKLEKMYVYSRMRRDEDNAEARYQALNDKAQGLIARVSASLSFFTPEFLDLEEEIVQECLKSNDTYEHRIKTLLREKAHVLGEKEEGILAQLSEVTSATGDIFTMLNNADIKFDDVNGEEVTHGNYINFMESGDRVRRKAAFESVYGAYEKQRNTLATTYSYNTKTDVVYSRIRSYPSSLQAALSGDNVDTGVYENLIESVNGRLPILHRYMDMRKRCLGYEDLHMYDVYVPIVKMDEEKIPFQEGVKLMHEGLAPLGAEYVNYVTRGVEDRWIDIYENEGKTSGAYSFGSYDSMPYILLNYTDTLKDVFTLVHEMGHSMHSYYTRRTQPFAYGGHSIFTAEVASTVNESLLMHHLLVNAENKERKKFLINMHIEAFRTTVFRQTMFAEFEKMTHEEVERGGVLTADYLCAEYKKLNEKYFGPGVVSDDAIALEWARIPHFYRAYYVYKYATGYSAATAISKIILDGSQGDYIEFLKSGDSDDPVELLKIAGVDMSSKEPVESAMDTFEALVESLGELI